MRYVYSSPAAALRDALRRAVERGGLSSLGVLHQGVPSAFTLTGTDATAQAARIRRQLDRLAPLSRPLLVVAYAPRTLKCSCGARCCSGTYPNPEGARHAHTDRRGQRPHRRARPRTAGRQCRRRRAHLRKGGAHSPDTITPADCANVLRPIWLEKAETASRTRQRMHTVLQWAWAHGHIAANPVSVVDHLLPNQNAKKEHQPAMPWRDIPEFAKAQLQDHEPDDSTRAALLFLILTAARSGEVRGATWSEFDLEAGIWTVPASRMKAGEPHRVPLSSSALALVRRLKEQKRHETLVFPSVRGKVLSDMTLTALLRRVKAVSDTPGRVATAHGFRSSFRDWASESGYARDLAERALAHTMANKVEAAYHRTDLLEQRRPMMQAWAAHTDCAID